VHDDAGLRINEIAAGLPELRAIDHGIETPAGA
jgi:hypothetical protein